MVQKDDGGDTQAPLAGRHDYVDGRRLVGDLGTDGGHDGDGTDVVAGVVLDHEG